MFHCFDKVRKCFLIFLFFIFIYPLQLTFFPAISSRVFLGLCGIVLLSISTLENRNTLPEINIKRRWVILCISLSFIFMVSLLTNTINTTSESYFLLYPFSMLMIFSASYVVTRRMNIIYHQVSFNQVSLYIVGAITLQMIITMLMFIFPALKEVLLGILTENSRLEISMESDEQVRIIGFGSQFFAAGIVNCFGLILAGIQIKYSIAHINFYKFSFILISLVGTIMSRTTLVGVLIAIVILSYKVPIHSLLIKVLKYIIFISAFIAAVVYLLPPAIFDNVATIFRFGFEMFYNYFDKGELASESTNQLLDMYDTYPQSIKTWIVGDGYYINPFDPTLYYMHTDVGYARLLFYFGIIGLSAYFCYQFFLIKAAYKCSGMNDRLFLVSVIVLLLALNFKGMTDITPLVCLFLFCCPKMLPHD